MPRGQGIADIIHLDFSCSLKVVLLLYDIKYFYPIPIVCTQMNDFEYSYIILTFYT